MRQIYAEYVKAQTDEVTDSIIIFLSYYDTTDSVRRLLNSKGVNVAQREKIGSIIILDIVKVINSPSYEVPETERLKELARKVEDQFKDKTIFIIAGMSEAFKTADDVIQEFVEEAEELGDNLGDYEILECVDEYD